jgi:monovalent cation/hydrogen antiporter
VLAVVVAALILGQRSTRASYATRLQDFAVWKALQLVLESFAFLLIGLQLPSVVRELTGIKASVIVTSSVAVLATVIVVRIAWIYLFAYLPRLLSATTRNREPAPTPAQVFIVAWAGMRGVVSLAAAFAVPLTTAFKRLRLEMLAAEREAFIAERDSGHIDDEVLRSVLRGLDLEEATLNRD